MSLDSVPSQLSLDSVPFQVSLDSVRSSFGIHGVTDLIFFVNHKQQRSQNREETDCSYPATN